MSVGLPAAGEKGTHRLVRSSPFNAKGLRQTSFAGVEVLPLLEDQGADKQRLVIPDKDLEVSFMRSGGKGGQNVNKVETGVPVIMGLLPWERCCAGGLECLPTNSPASQTVRQPVAGGLCQPPVGL